MKKLDIGHIINQSMLKYMRVSTSGGIPHASLVTRLCVVVGVEWDDEALQLPMRDIDHTTIQKYTIWNGAKSHVWGFIMSEEESESEDGDNNEEEEDTAAPYSASPLLGEQNRDICRLQRRMDAMHGNFQAYTTEFSGILSNAFSQLGAQVQFPTYVTATPYPPPNTPPEQEEDGDDANS